MKIENWTETWAIDEQNKIIMLIIFMLIFSIQRRKVPCFSNGI